MKENSPRAFVQIYSSTAVPWQLSCDCQPAQERSGSPEILLEQCQDWILVDPPHGEGLHSQTRARGSPPLQAWSQMQAHAMEYCVTKVAKHCRQTASKTVADHFALIADAKSRTKVPVLSKYSVGLNLLQHFFPLFIMWREILLRSESF